MLSARDLLLLARRTAGVSQAELGARVGRPRSTIARWELGEMEPGYDAVMQAVAACGLSPMLELANADSSYLHDVVPIFRGGNGLMPGVDLTSNRALHELLDEGLPLDKRR